MKNSVIGAGVIIEEGAVVRDSIVMQGAVIGAGTTVDKGIIAESVQVGRDCRLGVGEFAPNVYNPKVYAFDLVTIAENSGDSGSCTDWQEYSDCRKDCTGRLSGWPAGEWTGYYKGR